MTAELIDQSARYDAIRTMDWTYVEYGTGERELYDLARDPHQLENIADTADPALVAALSERLAALAECAAAECRRIEDLPGATGLPLLAKPQPDAMVIPAAATK
jgi:arylsulfatase A-like enzyme